MSILAISHILLWLIVLCILVTLLAILRQLGVLFERIAPLGAMMSAKTATPGMQIGPMSVKTIADNELTIGGRRADSRSQLLLFIAPGCPLCAQLLPIAKSFARSETKSVELVLVGEGSVAALRDYVSANGLAELPMVRDPNLAPTLQIGKLPYAVILDSGGVLKSSGLVNTREHLESLIVSVEVGHATLQEYVKTRDGNAHPSHHSYGSSRKRGLVTHES